MWQGFQERRFSYLQKKITGRWGKAKMRVQVLGKHQREQGSSHKKAKQKTAEPHCSVHIQEDQGWTTTLE